MPMLRLIVLPLLLFSFVAPVALAAPRPFESEARLFGWAEHYYRSPEPERLPEAARFLHDRLVFEAHPERYWPMVMFFGGAYAQDAETARAGADQAAASDDPFLQSFLLSALWASADERAQAELDRVAGAFEDERVAELLEYFEQNEAFFSTDTAPERPVHVSMLWGRFHATGEKAAIERVIDALGVGGGEKLERLAAEAARVSLAAQVTVHAKVAEVVRERLEREESASVRAALEEIARERSGG